MTSRKAAYLYILIIGLIILGCGFTGNFKVIIHTYYTTLANVQNSMIFVPAIICAFILTNCGYYWIMMVFCAFADAAVIHFLAGQGIYDLSQMSLTAFAFLVIVYFLNFLKSLYKD